MPNKDAEIVWIGNFQHTHHLPKNMCAEVYIRNLRQRFFLENAKRARLSHCTLFHGLCGRTAGSLRLFIIRYNYTKAKYKLNYTKTRALRVTVR